MSSDEMNQIHMMLGEIKASNGYIRERLDTMNTQLQNHISEDEKPGAWFSRKAYIVAVFFLATVSSIAVNKIIDRVEHQGLVQVWIPRDEYVSNYEMGPDGKTHLINPRYPVMVPKGKEM